MNLYIINEDTYALKTGFYYKEDYKEASYLAFEIQRLYSGLSLYRYKKITVIEQYRDKHRISNFLDDIIKYLERNYEI